MNQRLVLNKKVSSIMTSLSTVVEDRDSDPLYNPLLPSVEELLVYDQELEDECPWITFEWATYEIKNHLLNWVRVGLVAEKMRYLKLWREKFTSFADYCQQALGKSHWQISRIIKAARVTILLARAGFSTLPTCEAQASKLVKFLPDPQLLVEKWREVLRSVPKHLITANAIGEAFGEEPPKEKISLSKQLKGKLKRKALELGVSVEELLEDFLGQQDQVEEEVEVGENNKSCSDHELESIPHQARMARWQDDLEQICLEHQLKNWLSLTWLKLLVPS